MEVVGARCAEEEGTHARGAPPVLVRTYKRLLAGLRGLVAWSARVLMRWFGLAQAPGSARRPEFPPLLPLTGAFFLRGGGGRDAFVASASSSHSFHFRFLLNSYPHPPNFTSYPPAPLPYPIRLSPFSSDRVT